MQADPNTHINKTKYSKPISFTIFMHGEGATPFFFPFLFFYKNKVGGQVSVCKMEEYLFSQFV
jgi:hypothetical protein